jgi:hypothetical protein
MTEPTTNDYDSIDDSPVRKDAPCAGDTQYAGGTPSDPHRFDAAVRHADDDARK